MSWENNYKKYINLLNSFINGELTASEFDWTYSHLWMKDRDEEYKSEKYKKYKDRYIHEVSIEGRKLRNILDRVFTSCDVFNDDDDRAYYELNAVQLKEEVIKLREELIQIKEEEL